MSNDDISSTDIQITDLYREDDDLDQFRDDNKIRCEYSENEYCWSYQKHFLKVLSLEKNGESKLLSKFNFAHLLRDKTVFINNVTELKEVNYLNDAFNFCKFKLLVSLNRESTGSFLLIVDVKNQCILKCIECPFQIKQIEPIANNNGKHSKQDSNIPLCSELQLMCGIVALSTSSALVMILDLCLDTLTTNDCFDINQHSPSTCTFVVKKEGIINNYDLEMKRKNANIHNQHICISINEECSYKNEFRYDLDDENSIFPKDEIYISALKYFYQTNTLYIGYNFGGVHHFNLKSFLIYKTDQLDEIINENEEDDSNLDYFHSPIVGFSLQEPENDPKNFVYLWVLKGQLVQDFGSINEEDVNELYTCSSISLNQLEFENKTWIDNYGYLYSDLKQSCVRFNYYLTSNAFNQIQMNSIIVNYGIINQGSIQAYRKSKEDTNQLDSNLFYVVWQAFDEQIHTCVYYLMLFDLNQYYQAQLPPTIINQDLTNQQQQQLNPFLSFYKLNEIITLTDSGDLQDVKIHSNSFSRYQQTNNNNLNDIIYYPCSLSFKISFLSETKHLNVNYLSIQKKVINLLNLDNESIWLDSNEFLNKSLLSGILSLDELNQLNKSNKKKFEQILSIALDNNELPFLSNTIRNWSNPNNELEKYGCNCKLFLDWLWNEVEIIKKSIDEIVIPLFDLSDTYDSKQVLNPLYSNESKLKCLLALLNKLKINGTPTTIQGERELDLRVSIIQILIDYIQIILWCCSCDLLPETEEGNHLSSIGFTYPKTQFQADYNQTRKDLVSLNPTLIKQSDILTIDGLILNTKSIHELWKANENPTGLYPPTSIYSLVSIYLEDSVPIEIKHQIMLYSLLDIICYLSDRQEANQVEKLETFQNCFNINSSIVQSAQGMWSLDHKLFDFSLTHLCESNTKLTFPNLIDDFKKLDDDLQKRILTSFLYQNKKRHSLQFIKTSKLFNCDTLIKQKLYISVMLSNRLVLDAYNFQRTCRNKENIEELLFHFFLGCEQMNLFESVIKFTLDSLEKDTLIYYLLDISESVNSGNLLIIYLLLNKKFIDAHKFLSIIEDRIRKRNLDQDNSYYNKFLQIRSLVNSYIQVLPSSVVKLSLEINNHAENEIKKKNTCNLQQQKPKQVQINRQENGGSGDQCSNAVKEILNKIEKLSHTNNQEQQKQSPIHKQQQQITTSDNNNLKQPTTPFRKRIEQRGLLLSENSPFVKDLTPKKDKTVDLKNSLVANYSYGNSNGDYSYLETTPSNKLDNSSRNTENCSELLSLLSTPKIDKQQRNILASNYNPSVSGPSSILKVKQIMNSTNALNKSSSRKKKPTVSTKLSFVDKNQQQIKDNDDEEMMIDLKQRDSEENLNDMSIDIGSQTNLNQSESPITPPPMNPSFVFSPPLTRSKKKQTNKNDHEYDHEDYSFVETTDKKQEEKKSAKKTPKRTTKTPSKSVSSELQKTPTTATSKLDTPTHKMSLRTTRVAKKY